MVIKRNIMAINEGEQYLPEGDDMFGAFDVIKERYPNIPYKLDELISLPEEELYPIVTDIFNAGVAFLANRVNDRYIQEIGESMWNAINRKRVLTVATTDPRQAAFFLMCDARPDLDPIEILRIIREKPFKPDEPDVLFLAKGNRLAVKEVGYTILPIQFILKAINDPIEMLLAMVFIGSQIRDFANNRLQLRMDTPEKVNLRAHYMEAQFLLEVLKRYPTTKLSENAKRLRREFPNGLHTPSLPDQIVYKNPEGNDPKKSDYN